MSVIASCFSIIMGTLLFVIVSAPLLLIMYLLVNVSFKVLAVFYGIYKKLKGDTDEYRV